MNRLNQAYSEMELSSDVLSASSYRLIQLMLDKCLHHIELSKSCILSNDIPRKCISISKALDIAEYLRICLNHDDERTKELSRLLDSLYIYLQQNIVQANIHNDVQCLDEAKKILGEIKTGWDAINV